VFGGKILPYRSKLAAVLAMSYGFDGRQFGLGTVDLEASVSCGEASLEGARMTVKNGCLELKRHPAIFMMNSFRKWVSANRMIEGNWCREVANHDPVSQAISIR